MNYIGIDIHKRYCVCATQDEQGRKLGGARIEGNSASAFAQYLAGLQGPCKVAIEACWNWAKVYDLLETLPQIQETVVANPLKTRLIGEAQIKTDQIDANALATLLRGNFIARVHVPPKAVRARKNLLRQRLYWVRLRTPAAQPPARAARPPADAGAAAVQRSFWREGPRASAAAPAARTRRHAAGALSAAEEAGAGSGAAGPAQRTDQSAGKRHRRRQRAG